MDELEDDKNVAFVYRISDVTQFYIESTLHMKRTLNEHEQTSKDGASKLY
jgi:hypothetical protein